jgi:sterol desaturase/sphingolipid hydroxylase (fatty acid hydroxylase superfamily)
MTILDVFVRPEGSKPPLAEPFVLFNRISFTLLLNTSVVLAFYLHLFRQYKLAAFAVYWIIGLGTSVLDGLVSNSFGKNIQRIRQALGYSDVTILAIMEFNRFASQMLGYVVVNYVASDDEIYSFEYLSRHWNVKVAGAIATNFLLTEILFCLGHWPMHTVPYLMSLHVLHHCSVHSTWNTNLLFHPIDLAIEFAGPALGLLAMHRFVWQDQATLLCTYVLFQLIYAFEHDETMQLHHARYHHANCDSLYVIYSNFRANPAKNALRDHMQRRGMLDRRERPLPPGQTGSSGSCSHVW